MSQSNDVREQILKLDSIRALKKLMIEHGINVGNRNIHIGYLVEELLSLLEQSNRRMFEEGYNEGYEQGHKQCRRQVATGELKVELQHPEGGSDE